MSLGQVQAAGLKLDRSKFGIWPATLTGKSRPGMGDQTDKPQRSWRKELATCWRLVPRQVTNPRPVTTAVVSGDFMGDPIWQRGSR